MKAYIESIPPISLPNYFSGLFRTGDNFSDVLLTSRGRDAIQLAINYLQLKKNDIVLLPALTCDTVSGIFAGNCDTCFYDLNSDYSISLSELERLLNEYPEIKLLYVIHYFGFIQKNMQDISSLCKKHGIYLIEDHAHSALSKYRGDLADIYIYSFRKLFPTADGGGICGGSKESIVFDSSLKHKTLANLKGILIALKRFGSLYSKKIRSLIGGIIQNEIDQLEEGNSKIQPLPISTFGKGIITSSNIEIVNKARQELYLKWIELIETTPFKPIFPNLDKNIIPFGFPIKIQNNREIAAHFMQFNIFLKIHWLSMPTNTRNTCPVSHHLAETSITLPIYPGLKESQMHFIIDQLKSNGKPI